MKKSFAILASVVSALILPSCFQSETTVHLNKDGSGTLVEETRLGAQMLAMLNQMAGLGGEEAKTDPLKEMFSDEKAKKKAADLGEGVTFEKSEPVSVNGSKGARVTYKFKDINKLKLHTDDGMRNINSGEEQAPEEKKADPIGFTYAGGKLVIRMPEPGKPDAAKADKDAKEENGPDMESPQAQAMMKQMLGDMKVSVKVVVEPGIAQTNATHQDANTITLMEMNMGKIVEKPENMKKLKNVDKNDANAAMEALKGIDGMKIETQREVTVTLK